MAKIFRASLLFLTVTLMTFALGLDEAFAQRGGGGGHSMGFGLSLITANQKDLNSVMDATGAAYPGTFSTKNLGSAYEFYGQYAYRFKGSMFGLVIRPSYFMQSSTGNCGGGNCDYNLSGITIFPILRVIPLENSFIKFFIQGGVGYGNLKASVSEVSSKASFSGDAYGAMGGLGVDFCFTPSHCLTIEGNVRYLPVVRSTADSVSGTFTSTGFSQIQTGREVEYNGNDLSMTLSGLQGVLAYTLNF